MKQPELLHRWSLWRVALLVLLIGLGLSGCDSANDEAGRPGGSDQNLNTAPRTAASSVASILENPAVYYKQTMGIPGFVKEVLGPNALIVQDSANDKGTNELLVINQAQGQVTFSDKKPGDQVYVQGILQPFSDVQAQVDVPNAQQRFAERPVLLVTTVAAPDGGSSGSSTTTPTP